MRTVFNVLGPLTNPAGARDGVFGVYAAPLARTYAERLRASARGGRSSSTGTAGWTSCRRRARTSSSRWMTARSGSGSSILARSASTRPRPTSSGAEMRGGTPTPSAASSQGSEAGDATLCSSTLRGQSSRPGSQRASVRASRRGRSDRLGRRSGDTRAPRGILERGGARRMGRFADALRAPGLGAVAEIKRRSPVGRRPASRRGSRPDRPRVRVGRGCG